MTYDPFSVEKKWQHAWEEAGLGKAEPDHSKPKFFIHFAYPGPSGFFHIGHMRGYTYSDVIARIKRMQGYNVLFPVGVHATGNPAVGFATKVKKRDPVMMEYLKENGVTEQDIKKLESPEGVVEFFVQEYPREWKSFGIFADYDRITCTIWPDYQKFIEWQFKKLKDLGLLTQKPYYATFCTRCGPVAVDPSETDISKGGNARKEEYVALKFKLEDSDDYLVAVTLRPETVYGQTNLWIDPDGKYSRVMVGKEVWIVCRQAAEKLKYQKDDVEIISDVDPKELLGKRAIAPGIHKLIPILPAHFINLEVGTGVVTSVPSDAPDDYIGLRDLWENPEELEKYGIDPEEVKRIKVIPIINTPGYSDTPAKDVVEKLGVKNQFDREKLEEAKKIVYSKGFHTGVMNQNCGKYSGMPVNKAKELVKQELMESGEASTFWDLSEEVVCRCGSRVVIKKVEDQWFIRYSDPDWKEKSKAHAKSMRILPPEYYESMPQVIDWYDDRACTRMGSWLGTRLPFDQKWIIEPISDSTLYPVMYVLSRYTNAGKLRPGDMTEELLDYLLLGKGSPEGHGVPRELAEEMRKEFEYWYPVDLNVGGKEHKTVHFPVYVMNHVAIMKPEHWPKGIFVHWWMTGKGGKISKSKGGASTSIPVITKRRSVDALRLYYCHSASPFVDSEFDEGLVEQYEEHLQKFYSLVLESCSGSGSEEKGLDEWLESRVSKRIVDSEKSLQEYNFKRVLDQVFFGVMQDLAWYQKRGGNNKQAVKRVVEKILKVLCPFVPHVSEELWRKIGNNTLLSAESWPEPGEVNGKAIASEEMVQNLSSDIREVVRLVGRKPSRILLLVAPDWKRNALKKARELSPREMVKGLMQVPEVREKGKQGAKYAQFLVKHMKEIPLTVLSSEEEKNVLESASEYLSQEFGAEVRVEMAEGSDNPKAGNAVPMKPAIFVE